MKNNKIVVVGLAMVIVAIAITLAVVCVMLSKTNDRGKAKEVSNGNITVGGIKSAGIRCTTLSADTNDE